MWLHGIKNHMHKRNGLRGWTQNGKKKNFSSYTCDKGSITTIWREYKKLKSQKVNDPIKKWAKELNKASWKEEIQIGKTHEEILASQNELFSVPSISISWKSLRRVVLDRVVGVLFPLV
jgi:hypothetical protein